MILTTGVVSQLVARGADVSVVTAARFRPIFEGLPIADLRGPTDLGEMGSFDRVIDLQANMTSRRLLRGHGCSISLRSRPLQRRWLVWWGRRNPRFPIPHAVQRYAEAAGIRDAGLRALRPRVTVTEHDMLEARSYPRALDATDGPCVGLAVGGSRRMKRWPDERFERLSEGLASVGIATLRFLEPNGAGGEERGSVRAPLRPLKAILARCNAVVTNDSGVMHLAVSVGVPAIAIFGSTVPDFGFAPLGDVDRVVERDLPCRPCAAHGARVCWLGHGRCLGDIGVDEVLEAALQIMGRRGETGWTGSIR